MTGVVAFGRRVVELVPFYAKIALWAGIIVFICVSVINDVGTHLALKVVVATGVLLVGFIIFALATRMTMIFVLIFLLEVISVFLSYCAAVLEILGWKRDSHRAPIDD